jgi:tmRNA-binding protein
MYIYMYIYIYIYVHAYILYTAEHDRCSTIDQHKPKRTRKLLLNKKEILKLEQRVLQRNYEIIPIRMYFIENQVFPQCI